MNTNEIQTRIDLAACYRLAAFHQWDDLIFTHLSARLHQEPGAFLLAPFGVLFKDVRASDLIKVKIDANPKEIPKDLSPAAFMVHSSILAARPEARCVFHLHTVAGIAVSAQTEGLLPLSQQAAVLGQVSYHNYEGIVIREAEKEVLVRDLGQNWAMLLRNHGSIALGRSFGEAYRNIYALEQACRIQIAALAGNRPLAFIPRDIYSTVATDSLLGDGLSQSRFWSTMLRFVENLDPSFKQ